jgi:N-acyl amino acid synthase of PEP-CTERM/exosortase system
MMLLSSKVTHALPLRFSKSESRLASAAEDDRPRTDFLRYFHVAVAVTDEQRRLAARLRHRVYSEELGYEPTVSSRLESDPHDEHALHCLITHRASGELAGCARLILAGENAQMALEEHCLPSLHVSSLHKLNAHRDVSCEVSRLTVAPAFRLRRASAAGRRKDEKIHIMRDERRACSLVWFAALLAAVAMAESAGREHLYAMMDARLSRLLKRAGVRVQQAGEFTQYRGDRAAFFITSDDAVAGLSEDLIELFNSIRRQCARAADVERAATT